MNDIVSPALPFWIAIINGIVFHNQFTAMVVAGELVFDFDTTARVGRTGLGFVAFGANIAVERVLLVLQAERHR